MSWNIEGKIGVKKSFYILLLTGIIQSCLSSIPDPTSNSASNNANRYEKEVKFSTIAYQNRDDKKQLLARFSKKEIEPIVGRVPIHLGTATQIANSLTKDLSTDWEKAWVIFRWISENIDYILAIELLCAAQAVDLHSEKLALGKGTKRVFDRIRQEIPFMERDRYLSDDLNKMVKLLPEVAKAVV